MKTTSSSKYDYNEQFDWAVYKLERQEAQSLARKCNLFKLMTDSDPEVVELVCYPSDETICEFYPCTIWETNEMDNMPEMLTADVAKQQWGVLPEDYKREFTPRDALRAETLLVINREGFYWRAFPHASGLTITTQVLPRELLARVL